MALPQDDGGWEDVTDPSDVPGDVRKSLGVAGVRSALGLPGGRGGAQTPDGGKPLPQWAAGPYEKQINVYASLAKSAAGFKDDFAGNTLTGDVENAIQGAFGGFGTEGQRDWWAQFRTNDNKIRNELFGATLTPSEQTAYERTTITPSMDPAEVRRNLASRAELVQTALARKTKFLRAQGYSGEAIDALAGEYAPDFNPSLRAAKGGDQASVAAGVEGGSASPPPAGAPAPNQDTGGAVVFNDQLPQMSAQGGMTNEQFAAFKALAMSGAPADALAKLQEGFGKVTDDQSRTNLDAIAAFYADPKNRNTPLSLDRSREEVKPVDSGDGALGAGVRGAGNVLTLGLGDEAGAMFDTVAEGGTYAENLDQRRGRELYDEQNHGIARFAGQMAGGLPLGALDIANAANAARSAGIAAVRSGVPVQEARALSTRIYSTRTALEAAGLGGAYGFGNAEGDLQDRAVGGVIGAGTSAALGGGLAYGGSRFARAMAARRGGGAAPPTDGQEVLAAMQRRDVTPFAADVGGPVTRMATAGAAQTLGGVGPIRRAAQATLDTAQAVRDRVAQAIAPAVGVEETGEVARAGAVRFMAETGARIGRLYDRAGAAAGRAVVDTPDANRILSQELAPLEEAAVQSPGLAILQGLRDGLQTPTTVRGLRSTRTAIRGAFENAGLRGSNEERIANRVVDAATDDLVNGLRAQGLDTAARQYRVADRLWRARLETIDENLAPIVGDATGPRAKSGEQIVQGLAAAMQGNNRRFAGFIQALPDEERAIVRSSLISRLGQAAAGQQDQTGEVFSLPSFLTHYTKIGARARQTLFGEEGRAALDDLATIAGGAKGAQRYANFSNTGSAATTGVLAGATAFGPLGLLSAAKILAVQYGAGRLLASPRFARWLARPPRQTTPAAAQAYVARLSRIARAEPAIASDVLSLQRRLVDAFGTAPARLAADERDSHSPVGDRQRGESTAPQQGLQP